MSVLGASAASTLPNVVPFESLVARDSAARAEQQSAPPEIELQEPKDAISGLPPQEEPQAANNTLTNEETEQTQVSAVAEDERDFPLIPQAFPPDVGPLQAEEPQDELRFNPSEAREELSARIVNLVDRFEAMLQRIDRFVEAQEEQTPDPLTGETTSSSAVLGALTQRVSELFEDLVVVSEQELAEDPTQTAVSVGEINIVL